MKELEKKGEKVREDKKEERGGTWMKEGEKEGEEERENKKEEPEI